MDTDQDGGGRLALATLAVRRGPGSGTDLPVRLPAATVGRGGRSEVPIDDDSVSTRHALLQYEDGAWRITDLGSANGTFVEGVRLAPDVATPLSYGSTVRFGAVETHFRPVAGADPDAAREAYAARPPRTTVAERRAGPRLPLWVLLVLIIILAALWFGLVWTPEPGMSPAAPLQEREIGFLIRMPAPAYRA